jgi:hypothetical protein
MLLRNIFHEEVMEKSYVSVFLPLFDNAVIDLGTRNCIYFNDNTNLLIFFFILNHVTDFNYNFHNSRLNFKVRGSFGIQSLIHVASQFFTRLVVLRFPDGHLDYS